MRGTRARTWREEFGALILCAVWACQPSVPTSAPSGTPTAPPATAIDLTCEVPVAVPCIEPVMRATIPIPGTAFELTYRSDRVPGWSATPARHLRAIGLGGWSLDVLATYDPRAHLLIPGDGRPRVVEAIAATAGPAASQLLIASLDGSHVAQFDATGRHTRTLDTLTGATILTFEYDAAGRLAAIGDRTGKTTTIERDEAGLPTGIRSPLGPVTLLRVDEAGNLASVVRPGSGGIQFEAGADGLLTSRTEPGGYVSTFGYDAAGRLRETTDAQGATTRYERTTTASTETITVTGADGRAWAQTIAASSGGGTTRSIVEPGGALTEVTDRSDGTRSVTLHDGVRIEERRARDPRWGSQTPILATRDVTTPGGLVQHVTGEQLVDLADPADPLGVVRSVATLTVDGVAYRRQYDAASRTLVTDGPAGERVEEVLDDAGRAAELRLPGQAPVTVAFDAFGRSIGLTTEADGKRRALAFRPFDGEGVVEIVDPADNDSSVVFDESGRVRGYTAPDGSFVALQLDAAGRLLSIAPPGLDPYVLGYDGVGRQTSLTAPDGTPLDAWRYDAPGRLLERTTGAGTLALGYDAAGRLESIRQPSSDVTVAYADGTSRPSKVATPAATLDLAWDGAYPTSSTWSGGIAGRVAVVRDASSRIVSVSVDGGATIQTSWSAAGLPEQVGDLVITYEGVHPASATLGSLQLGWEADAFGGPASFTAASAGNAVFSLDLDRDLLGRVTAAKGQVGPQPVDLSYGYDEAGRLASTVDGSSRTAVRYDARGNRIAVDGPGGARVAVFDTLDHLTGDGNKRFEYDAGGRLSRRTDGSAVTTFEYDLLGSLASVGQPDGRRIDYLVDGLGRRVGKRVDGKLVAGWLYMDGRRPVAQLGPGGAVVATFGYVGESPVPAMMVRGGRTYAILTDWLGSPRLVVDASTGAIAQAIEYDAFGRVVADSAPGFQPFGFAGGLYDPDTGLVLFGARDYDAATGRWTAPDPLGFGAGDTNLYRYAFGDPVNLVDRSGLQGAWGACGGRPQTYPWTFGVSIGTTFGASPAGIWSSGFNAQYIPGHGVAVYTYVPNGDPSSGGGFAGSIGASANIGYQGGCPPEPGKEASSWEGPFTSAGGGVGPFGAESYWSDFDPDNPNTTYKGVEAGGGIGLPGSAYYKKTAYKCILNCGASHGDPHVFTPDRLHYEFQAVGEFVALESASRDMVVQLRQQPYRDSRMVSVNTAVAMLVAGDRVGVYQAPGEGGEASLHVDGQPVTMTTLSLDLPHGGRVERVEGGGFDVVWPDGSRVRATVYHMGALDILVDLAAVRGGAVQGLFGNFDGEPDNDMTTRDGETLAPPATTDAAYRATVYERFGESWRVSPGESVFEYAAGESTATFTDRSFPDAVASPESLPAAVRAAAKDACRGAGVTDDSFLAACILDVGLTGDPGFAISTGTSQAGSVPPSPTQEFWIGVGAVVGPDLPAPGAGAIAEADGRDVYRLKAPASGVVYLEARPGCVAEGLTWTLRDAAGTALPNHNGATSLSVCQTLGRIDVQPGAQLSLVVEGEGSATGAYGFTLTGVAPDSTFRVAIGDTVGVGRPGPGAGVIATEGEVDRFVFQAAAGDRLYIATTTPITGECESGIGWDITGPPGVPVAVLPGTACIDLEDLTIKVAGDYTIEFVSGAGTTGVYGFTIWRVPPDREFALALNATASLGSPGPGAGSIEGPGSADIYRIAVTAGQSVTIVPATPSGDCGTLRYRVLDPDGSILYSNEILCAGMDRPAVTVHQGGDLVIRVFGDGANTGEYSFRVTG